MGHDGRLVELERLLSRLCTPAGSDVLALHWLLAGRCLGELPEPVREQLERLGIGARIRRQLLTWLGEPVGPELQRQVRDVLAWTRTAALVDDPAALALLAAAPPGAGEATPLDQAPRPESLGDLLAQWPATWVGLGQLCLTYNIRVLPDHSIILPDGRQLPGEQAASWLRLLTG